MSDAKAVLEGLTNDEKWLLSQWRFKSWVDAHNAPHSLVAAGLFDQQMFPAQHRGKVKRRLNSFGIQVRALIEEQKI